MSNQLRLLAVLASTALVAGPIAAPAGAALGGGSPIAAKVAPTTSTQSRLGGSRGFGRRSPSLGTRRRVAPAPRNRVRRSSPFRGLGGSILRALGIAYLVHMLFGWGPGGGSPFGLLLVLGVVLWLVMLRRRRRFAPAGYRY